MEVINQILILFIIILVGFILRKKGLINNSINSGISKLLVEIVLPALILDALISIDLTPELLNDLILMGIVSVICYLLIIITAQLLSKYLGLSIDKKNVFIMLLAFGNVGYMGFPIIDAAYPQQGIVLASINIVVFNIFLWTYIYYLFTKENSKNDNFKLSNLLNNGIIAVLIGFIVLFSDIELGPIAGAVESIGSMTFPLSMLIIGSSLSGIKTRELLKDKIMYLIVVLKLMIIPLIAILIIRLFNLPQIVSNISILLLAMPSGAMGVVFAENYNSDYKFASKGVVFTTLLSIITIPLILYLIT